MDLNTIAAVLRPADRDGIAAWQDGDAVLAGGTWLFSEPQPRLRRLVDLERLGWEPLQATPDGLRIAATCTIAQLAAFEPPPAWRAASVVAPCCNALLGSFKIWNMATVGGNLCLALPAAPMAALAVAMDGACTVWTQDGGERAIPAADFVTGPQANALQPGEILRAIHLPAAALSRAAAFRRISLSPQGRSAALLIGTQAGRGFSLTITAATPRPVRIDCAALPDAAGLQALIEAAIPPGGWYDDLHGRPDWRRHMTLVLAEDIRRELDA